MVTRLIVSVLLTVLLVGTTAIGQAPEKPLPPPDYAVKVLAPSGGEKWTVNTTQMVLWELNTADVPDSIRIRLTWKVNKEDATIVKGQRVLATIRGENPGKWEWEKVGPVGDGLRIQVEAFFPNKKKVSDASDEAFAIVAQDVPPKLAYPIIKILSPNGGEVWTVGSKQMIKWAAEPVSAVSAPSAEHPQAIAKPTHTVRISLSGDGGNTWQVIADRLDLPMSGWEWTIPDKVVADKCRLRVALLDKASTEICKDVSDGDFQITPGNKDQYPADKPAH